MMPTPEVVQAAKRHMLGTPRRILVLRKERLRGEGEVTARVFEFDEGIVYQNADNAVRAYPWRSVSHVFLESERFYLSGKYGYTMYSFTLLLADGGRLTRTGVFKDPALYCGGLTGKKRAAPDDEYTLFRLMSAASEHVARLLLPDALARLRRGEELPFGEIAISRDGIRSGGGPVPWSAVTDVQLKQGVVRIRRAGSPRPLTRQKAGRTPNLPLFLTLVETLRRTRGS